MDFTSYKAPPITEAVIELKLGALIEPREKKSISNALKHLYPTVVEIQDMDVDFDLQKLLNTTSATGTVDVRKHLRTAYRRTSFDQTEVCLIADQSILISQLSPYPGWDVFFERIKSTLNVITEASKPYPRKRLGVRYINRIDLPVTDEPIRYEDYFRIFVNSPQEFGPNVGYSGRVRFDIPELMATLVINTGSTKSPIPHHMAFILDLDIGVIADVPVRNDELFALLTKVRAQKNKAFEMAITDKAREKFKS